MSTPFLRLPVNARAFALAALLCAGCEKGSIEGKRCDGAHPCVPGYECVESGYCRRSGELGTSCSEERPCKRGFLCSPVTFKCGHGTGEDGVPGGDDGGTPLSDADAGQAADADGQPPVADELDCDLDDDGKLSARCGGDDCHDLNPALHPGAIEACSDGLDNDCDGLTDCEEDVCKERECGGEDMKCCLLRCVDTAENPFHCGGCNNSCPQGTSCFSGECVSNCPSRTVKCGAACTDLETSKDNCGRCGKQCPDPQNSRGYCEARQCRIVCADGFFDANGMVSDGCECRKELNVEVYCSNGIDDDCNGLLDCYDPPCAAAPACKTLIAASETLACFAAASSEHYAMQGFVGTAFEPVSMRSENYGMLHAVAAPASR